MTSGSIILWLVQKMFCVGDVDWCESLTSLANNDAVSMHDVTSSSSADDVILLAPSSDIHDSAQIVQLTHGNLIACWTQLRSLY